MISKIKNIQGDGSWESNYGTLYSFEYEFEDGTVLKANHKTQQSPFQIGQEAEYEITKQNEYGKSGKVKKPEQKQQKKDDSFWEEKDRKIAIGHAINNAVQIVVGIPEIQAIGNDKLEARITKYAKMILKISEELNQEGKAPVIKKAEGNTGFNKEPGDTVLTPEKKDDDLPF